jgi:hypothetical protein
MANPNPPNRDKLKRGGPGRSKGSRNKLTVERVEQEIRRLALIDPIALFDRVAKGKRTFTLRQIVDMDADTRACISSVKVKTENLAAGDNKQDQTVEIKLWDKVKALEMCAKHFRWIEDKIKLEVNVSEIDARLRAAQKRVKGND